MSYTGHAANNSEQIPIGGIRHDVAEASEGHNLASEPTSEQKRPRILLAEDDTDLRSLIRIFHESEGYDVLSCSDGLRAINVGKACETVDLLISDLEMPHVTGGELAVALSDRNPLLQVILISGAFLTPQLEDLIRSRRWRFLPKPFDFMTLLTEVHKRAVPRSPEERAQSNLA